MFGNYSLVSSPVGLNSDFFFQVKKGEDSKNPLLYLSSIYLDEKSSISGIGTTGFAASADALCPTKN